MEQITSTSPGATSQAQGVKASCNVSNVGCSKNPAAVTRGFFAARMLVAFPCGSRSMTRVAKPFTVAAPAKPSTIEVLPTPPFKLSTLTIGIAEVCPVIPVAAKG